MLLRARHSCRFTVSVDSRIDSTMAHVPGVKPPQPLQLGSGVREDWVRWKEDWQDYSVVQKLSEKPDEAQVALFRIALGSEAKKLLRNQPVPNQPGKKTPMDTTKVTTLLQMMETAVMGETNDTYELHMFFQRSQKDSETFDQYLTELKEKVKYCDICECMHDRLIKAQIILGVPDVTLQEKLLQERKLTLEKCIDMCRAAESAATQMKDLSAKSEVNRVSFKKSAKCGNYNSRISHHHGSTASSTQRNCLYCGRNHPMVKKMCPAVGKTCNKCGKLGHFATKCDQLKKKVHHVSAADDEGASAAECGNADNYDTDNGEEIGAVHSRHDSSPPKAKMRVHGKNKAFLLDTGASSNLISTHDVDMKQLKLVPPGRMFTMWNGSLQKSMGKAVIDLYNPKSRQKHKICFEVVSDNLIPILGAEAVQSLGLVTMHRNRYEPVAAVKPALQTKQDFLDTYPDVFGPAVGSLAGQATIKVDAAVTPTALPARQVPIALRQPLKEELRRLEELGVITPVTEPTPWVSQAVCVDKGNGTIRLCLDPRPLNVALKREHYHLPTFEELLPDLAGAKVFSKLDLKNGYWHVALDEASSLLTCFQTIYGRHRWCRLPFGLSVSSEIFSRRVHEALQGLEGVHCVADDIIIAGVGDTVEDATASHDKRLHAFLQQCQDKGVVLNPDKFKLRAESLPFMGHILGPDGIRPDGSKVKAIREMPAPTDVTGVRRLLGTINFLAKYVPHLSTVVKPIQALVCNDVMFSWGPEHDAALRKVKAILSSTPVLAHFDPAQPLVVQCDASKDGLGAALMQQGHPLAYASRTLTASEQNYAQIEKELLSVLFAMEKFHHYTYGREVTVENDHKPLVAIHSKPIAKAPMRLQRMLLRLLSYTYTFVHVPGKDLILADALSRAYVKDEIPRKVDPLDSVHSVITSDLTDAELSELQTETAQDPHTTLLLRTVKDGWVDRKKDCPKLLTPYWDYRDELTVCQEILLKGQAILIPKALRQKYVNRIHSAHQGAESCVRRARDSVFWPGISADIRDAVDKCEICARAAPRQQKQPLQQPSTPNTAWHTVSADIFTLERKDYLVTVDALSGFFEVDRLKTLTSSETILKLRMAFARYGSPRRLLTDNAGQFTSREFKEFTTQWRIEHRTSSPHFPRSNGLAESGVKVAKNIIKKAKESKSDVYQALLDHRNTPRMATGLSPAQVLFQHATRTTTLPHCAPPTATEQQARQKKNTRQLQVKRAHDKAARPLSPLPKQAKVWFKEWRGEKELWSKGIITDADPEGQSYTIESDQGTFRRNRSHMRRDTTSAEVADGSNDAASRSADRTKAETRAAHGYGYMPPTATRYGRAIKPVAR